MAGKVDFSLKAKKTEGLCFSPPPGEHSNSPGTHPKSSGEPKS